MITVNRYPDGPVLAGNPVELDITGSNQYSQAGSFAFFMANFATGEELFEGDSFTLSWGTESVTFVFTATPDESGTQYQLPGGLVTTEVAYAFYAFMAEHYLIARDFNYNGTNGFFMKSRGNFGLGFSGISNPVTISFSVVPGTDRIMRDSYQLLCQVWDAANNMLGEEAVTPDNSGNAVFDVSEYLYSKLETQRATTFSYPWPGGNFIKHATHTLGFKLKYAEKWNAQVQLVSSGATIRALMSGVGACSNAYITTKFLTNTPAIKKISANCPERLYYYNETTRTVNLQSKKYFASGSTLIETVGSTSLLAGQVYEIDADILGAAVPEAGEVVKYDLWLALPDGTAISETKTFVIDYRYYRNTDYFFFLNSLGGYDLLRCTGRRTREQLVEREEFEDENRNRRQYYNVMEETFTANTGSISADMEAWLDDFMLSKDVYWISPATHHSPEGEASPVKVIITNKKKVATQDDQRRFNLSFDFAIAKKEEYA